MTATALNEARLEEAQHRLVQLAKRDKKLFREYVDHRMQYDEYTAAFREYHNGINEFYNLVHDAYGYTDEAVVAICEMLHAVRTA